MLESHVVILFCVLTTSFPICLQAKLNNPNFDHQQAESRLKKVQHILLPCLQNKTLCFGLPTVPTYLSVLDSNLNKPSHCGCCT